jgi:hypothetical protein
MAILNLIPAKVDLSFLSGGTYTTSIQLYQDTAQTTAFDLTGYTVALVVGTLFTLTSGSGLSIPTPTNGTITATLTAAQTAQGAASVGISQDPWYLRLTDGSGNVSYPVHGTVNFSQP